MVTKDIPEGEVWGGVPARKLTTVKEFIIKREDAQRNIEDIQPKNLKLSSKDKKLIWEKFYESRILK